MPRDTKPPVATKAPAFSADDSLLIERARDAVLAVEPRAQVILYGSRARGDSSHDSDWDLIILLDGPVDSAREDRIRRRLHQLELETTTCMSSIVHNRDEWDGPRSLVTPFHASVEDDGIDLVTMKPAPRRDRTQFTEAEMAEARDEVVAEWMARSRRTLAEAETRAQSSLWEGCVGRLYYACFDVVRALLLARGHRFSRHAHVQSLFNQHFVHTGVVPADLGELYNVLFAERGRADYEAFVRFDSATVRPWVTGSGRLVELIAARLDEEPGGRL